MKEKIEIIDYKYRITILTFIIFMIIGVLVPLSGDDYSSYLIGKKGILSCLQNIDIKDGRFISGFFTNFFSYNKIFFDISLASLMSYFVKICNDLMGSVKNKYAYLYPLVGVLMVNVFMFSYNYLTINAALSYTFPSIMIIIYYYLINTCDEMNYKVVVKLILLSLFIMLSSIYLAIAFFISNILNIIVKYNKKNGKKHLLLLLLQISLLIFSLLNMKGELFFLDKNYMFNNIPYLIEEIFSKNILLIVVGAIPINYYLHDKLKNNMYCRVIIALFDLILAFSLCYNFFHYSFVNLNLVLSKYSGVFATENWYYIIYFSSYIVLFVLSVNHFLNKIKVRYMVNNLIVISLIILLFIVISPMLDNGNIIFLMFTIILSCSILSKDMNVKVYSRTIRTIFYLLIIYYISVFAVVKYIDITRSDYIKEQLDANDTRIEVKANPINLIYKSNPSEGDLINNFKKYYEIPLDYSIEVKYFGIFEKIERKVKEDR